MTWGVMFQDSSVATEWSGPNARARCEADVLESPWTILVRQAEGGGWTEEWPRPRFKVQQMKGPFDGPRVALECMACGYLTNWHSRAAAGVPAFEEHWLAQGHRLAHLGIEEEKTS